MAEGGPVCLLGRGCGTPRREGEMESKRAGGSGSVRAKCPGTRPGGHFAAYLSADRCAREGPASAWQGKFGPSHCPAPRCRMHRTRAGWDGRMHTLRLPYVRTLPRIHTLSGVLDFFFLSLTWTVVEPEKVVEVFGSGKLNWEKTELVRIRLQ